MSPQRMIALLAWLAACSAAPETAVGPPFGDGPCFSCVQDACRSEILQCGADPACAAYLTCVAGCPAGPTGDAEPGCQAGCPPTPSSEGKITRQMLDTCRSQGAGAACLSCGQSRDRGGQKNPVLTQQCQQPSSAADCQKCQEERCCQTRAMCSSSAACKDLSSCYATCADQPMPLPCFATCRAKFPTGLASYASHLACISVLCQTTCVGPVNPCQECRLTQCADSYVDCMTKPECFILDECNQACLALPGDQRVLCWQDCFDRYPAAQAAFQANQLCGQQRCFLACNL